MAQSGPCEEHDREEDGNDDRPSVRRPLGHPRVDASLVLAGLVRVDLDLEVEGTTAANAGPRSSGTTVRRTGGDAFGRDGRPTAGCKGLRQAAGGKDESEDQK